MLSHRPFRRLRTAALDRAADDAVLSEDGVTVDQMADGVDQRRL
jgi:hypothetical protein